MDGFAMILGMGFFDKVHAFPIPATNSLSIFDGSKACVVPAERAQPEEKTLSVMQWIRGFQKDPGHLVSIRQHDKGKDSVNPHNQVPQQVQTVHGNIKDVKPPKLLKTLPPRREVEHKSRKHNNNQHHNNTPKKKMTACVACGETTPKVKQRRNARKTYDKSQNKSKWTRTRSWRRRREHKWGRIVMSCSNLLQSKDNSAHTGLFSKSPPRCGVRLQAGCA